ncbi:MAG TPA: TAXI family TRAP transporter solute-binding subunit [Beijerinckiaceae bacterium]|nr:TAXI family TRAP transporter solute-binding subunit [Beijerinckiaceae bacterium]
MAPGTFDRADTTPVPPAAPTVITVLAGDIDGTAARVASDISKTLDSDDLHVLPVLDQGAMQSLRDIATSPYLDLAIVPSDTLDQARAHGLGNAADSVVYLAPLYHEEVQILARGDVATIRQLDGRKVAVGAIGSATADRASAIFDSLGIKPQIVDTDSSQALSMLQQGALDAVVFADGKPIPALKKLPPNMGLHFVAVPYGSGLQNSYYPARIDSTDYPNLVAAGTSVDTIALGTVLAAYDAPQGSPRYRKLAKFTQAFFRDFDGFLQAGRNPKWHEVNFAAKAPGWRRFKPAQNWLDSSQDTTAAN